MKSLDRDKPESRVVLYTDIGDSTAITDALGDVAARQIQRVHDQVIRGFVSVHGGIEYQPTGDGFKVGFDSVTSAIACAVDVQVSLETHNREGDRFPIRVRIGIHQGEVIEEGGDIFGRNVIIANRIMSHARPGQILMSEDAYALAERLPVARYLDRGIYRLKGIRRGYRLYEVVWQSTPETKRSVLIRQSGSVTEEVVPFVGREVELRQLDAGLEAIERSRSHVIVLEGEAGIGKSRLAAQFLDVITQRSLALASGRCYEDLCTPYQPVLDWLRSLLSQAQVRGLNREIPDALAPDLAPLVHIAPDLQSWLATDRPSAMTHDAAEQHIRLLNALSTLLLDWSRHVPLVLHLEDLHAADRETVDFLKVLFRRMTPMAAAPDARLLVLCTSRIIEDGDAPVRKLVGELERDGLLVRIVVGGLARNDLSLLLRELHGRDPGSELVNCVFERSQGNPYFALEIYRELVATTPAELTDPDWSALALQREWAVPIQIRRVLEQRLGRFDAPTIEVLQIASLLGAHFSFGRLRTVTRVDDEVLLTAVEAALCAHVLREDRDVAGVRYAFVHSLVARSLRDRMSTPRREQVHWAIALALEEHFGNSVQDHATEIAHHLLEAGGEAAPQSVLTHCRQAGDLAIGRYAYREAADFFEAALQCSERLDEPLAPRQRAELLHRMLIALGHTGGVARAQEQAEKAIKIYTRIRDRNAADRVRADIAGIYMLHAGHADALPYLKIAAKRAESTGRLGGAILADYAVALDLTGNSDGLRTTANQVLRIAEETKDPALRQRGWILLRNWHANHTSEIGRALSLTGRLLRNARRRGDPSDMSLFWEQTAFFQLTLGRVGQALESLDLALEAANRIGIVAKMIDVRALRAMCHCYRGDWMALDEEWEHVAPFVARGPGALRLGQFLWVRARTDLWLGRGRPQFGTMDSLHRGMPAFETAVLAFLGVMASELDDQSAESLLSAAAERQSPEGDGVNWLAGTQSLAAGWANLRRPAEAATWSKPLLPYRATLSLEPTALTLGRTAALCGDWQAATTHLGMSARICRREGLRPYLGLTLVERARMYRARGRRSDAASARRLSLQAAEIFDNLGMKSWSSISRDMASDSTGSRRDEGADNGR